MKEKRVAIYCRVANPSQYELDAQTEELRLYAKNLGYKIIAEMSETGSGLTLDRPALSEVTEIARQGKVDAVLVKDISRIGRGYGLTEEFIRTLDAYNVSLICIKTP